jgi:molybdopterin converting factor small subunit
MRVRTRYFAAARDAAGLADEFIEVDSGTSIATVRALLIERHPALQTVLRQSRLALNQRFVVDTDVVVDVVVDDEAANGGAHVVELAVIPPVAGG